MNPRLLQLTLVAAAALSNVGSAQAELITLPEVPITVADCRPSDRWGVVNGRARCVPNSPPDTCANHGYWSTDQGGGSAYVPGVGTCYNQKPVPVYVPQPVPQNPAAYILTASGNETMNGYNCRSRIERYQNGSGTAVYNGVSENGAAANGTANHTCDPAALVTPWGYDLGVFFRDFPYLVRDPGTLGPAMQYFRDRGCAILSDNAGLKSQLQNLIGYWPQDPYAGGGYLNYAVCSSAVY